MCGIFKAGQIAKRKPLVGQCGRVSWNARLDSQLGAFHFENEKNLVAAFFNDAGKLKRANSCFALLSALLPERESYPRLYDETLKMLRAASDPPGRHPGDVSPHADGEEYLRWELCLLSELGYGLSLEKCGNCGAAEDLKYISPKTGRAICADCGREYVAKLFGMPPTLNETRYFLSQIAELPNARMII
jgi:DNA repair protein RecO (recombination protein O)